MANHESHEIELLTQEGSVVSVLSVTELDDRDDLVLRLEFADEVIELSALSCWDGLQRIREQLDSRSMRLVCFGASENVHASGMSASMGIGDRAYKLTLGVPGRTSDIVGIFGTGPDVLPVSVAQQEAFYDRWLASLKHG